MHYKQKNINSILLILSILLNLSIDFRICFHVTVDCSVNFLSSVSISQSALWKCMFRFWFLFPANSKREEPAKTKSSVFFSFVPYILIKCRCYFTKWKAIASNIFKNYPQRNLNFYRYGFCYNSIYITVSILNYRVNYSSIYGGSL